MAKETKKTEKPKAKAAPKKAESKDVPDNPQADDQAVVGSFVEVVSGDHKGVYGVLVEAHSLDTAIVRTRDSDSQRIVTKYSDLVPAEAGRF